MFGVEEVLLIFVIVLVVFGPDKLPEVAKMLGKATKEFRKITSTAQRTWDEIGREMELQEAQDRAKQLESQQAAGTETQASEVQNVVEDKQEDVQEEAGDPERTEESKVEERDEGEQQVAAASMTDTAANEEH